MKSDLELIEKLSLVSTLQMTVDKKQSIWSDIERGMVMETHAPSRGSRFRFVATGGVGVAAILIALAGVNAVMSHSSSSNQRAAGREQGANSTLKATKFDLSFVVEPSKTVPTWMDGGNGVVVAITLNSWDVTHSDQEGVYIIPTSIHPSQGLSLFQYPNSPEGSNINGGEGPQALTDTINQYLQKQSLGALSGTGSYITASIFTPPHAHFEAVIGNSGHTRINASDLRIAVVDARETGNNFQILWGKVYSPAVNNFSKVTADGVAVQTLGTELRDTAR